MNHIYFRSLSSADDNDTPGVPQPPVGGGVPKSQQTQNDFVSTSTSPQQEQAQQDGLLGPHQSQELMPTSQQVGGGDTWHV